MEKLETGGHCALEGRRGISQLRYLPGDECSCSQVTNGSFLSGNPRSHPEGAMGANQIHTQIFQSFNHSKGLVENQEVQLLTPEPRPGKAQPLPLTSVTEVTMALGMGLPWAAFATTHGPIRSSGG